MVFVFGDHRLDVERRELRRGRELIGLEPQVFDVLTYLVRHRDRVVSHEDLRRSVWGGRIVSYSALASRINAVRRAVGDDGTVQRLVRTFPRKGVRFVGEAMEFPDGLGSLKSAAATDAPLSGFLSVDKPSIAVLPFHNLSGDPAQDYFADGMVEEITTALSRIRWLFVIASNSSFTYKRQAIDVKRVGWELGVRYLLEGSVRKSGDRVRITAQLVETETGAHLWADRFDDLLADIFELQDNVAASVAGVIEPTLQTAETARSAYRPTSDLTAYDLYLRAYATYFAGGRFHPEALRLAEQAIALDPHYGVALSWAAICCFRLIVDGRSGDPVADRRKGADFARRALEVASEDPGVLANVAHSLAFFGEDLGSMIALADRAVALNPSFARGWHVSGALRFWASESDAAIEHLQFAQRLSPRARVGSSLYFIGGSHFLARRFDAAISTLLLAVQEDPSFPWPYRYLAASYAHLGQRHEAQQAVRRLREVTNCVMPVELGLRNPEGRELLLSGLRLAMDGLT